MTGPLDELADVLITISASLGRVMRDVEPSFPHAADLAAIDRSFTRSISLTREIREQVQARGPRGEYTSTSYVARDVVGRLQTVVPDTLSILVQCPPGPAIVAAQRADVRRVMAGLLESGIEASQGVGLLSLDVSETNGVAGERQRRIVQIDLRSAKAIDERDLRIGTSRAPDRPRPRRDGHVPRAAERGNRDLGPPFVRLLMGKGFCHIRPILTSPALAASGKGLSRGSAAEGRPARAGARGRPTSSARRTQRPRAGGSSGGSSSR